jgi:hypothetical protein
VEVDLPRADAPDPPRMTADPAGERWRNVNTAVAEPGQPSEIDIAPSPKSNRRNWWAITSAATLVAALALGGVLYARSHSNGNSASNNVALTGVTWTDPHSGGAVVFLDGSARVTASCGTDTHPLAIDGDRLTIGTKILGVGSACADPCLYRTPAQQRRYDKQVQATARFLRIVDGPATWSITGDRLTLTKSGVGAITLVTDGAPAPQLVGTHWRLADYYYDGGSTSNIRSVGRRSICTLLPTATLSPPTIVGAAPTTRPCNATRTAPSTRSSRRAGRLTGRWWVINLLSPKAVRNSHL